MGFLERFFDRLRGISPAKRRRWDKGSLAGYRQSLDACRHLLQYAKGGQRKRFQRIIAALEKRIAKLDAKLAQSST